MADELPPQEEATSRVGGRKSPVKPSIIIPPRETRKGARVIIVKGKKTIEGAEGEEEEIQPPQEVLIIT